MNEIIDSAINLGEGFHLVKANFKEFAIHYTTYRENIWFRQSWERRLAVIDSDTPCYWIMLSKQRVGGVSLQPNMMWSFFLEPPFSDTYMVASKLKKFLVRVSDQSKSIEVHGILPCQAESFRRLGFLPRDTRRVMIRPTEALIESDLNDSCIMTRPDAQQTEELAQMFYQAFVGADAIGYPGTNTVESQREALTFYFEHNGFGILNHASGVIFDRSTEKPVAACLISLWEDLPLVSNIAVLPSHRGNGLATALLNQALTVLHSCYDVVRLFVTVGNGAEALYYNLGFHPGVAQTTLYLSERMIANYE